MATTTYQINVNTNSAIASINQLQSALGKLEKSAGTIKLSLGNMFSGFAVAGSVTAIAALSDAVANVNNRLINVSKSTNDANTQFNALAAISMNTRTSLDSVSKVYNKIMMSSETLGINQKQAAQYTTTLAQALALTGSTGAEAASTMTQFAQGLSSGVFQGDELKSILENNIVITQALAKQMGVSTSEIKKMGSEGKITADIMLKALASSADDIANRFSKMTPTISQALETLKTSMMVFWNEFEKNTQTGQNIAKSIEYMANSMKSFATTIEPLIGPILTLGKVLMTLLAFTVVGRIFEGITLVFGALGSTIAAITSSTGVLATVWTEITTVATAATGAGLGFRRVLGVIGAGIEIVMGMLGPFAKALGGVLGAAAAWFGLGEIGDWFSSFSDSNSEATKKLEEFRKENTKAALEGLDNSKKIATGKQQISDASKKVSEQLSKETAALEKQIQAYKDANTTALSDIKVSTAKLGMSENDISLLDNQIRAFDEYRQQYNQIQADINAKKATGSESDLAMIPKLTAAQNELTRAYELQIPALNDATNAYNLANQAKQLSLYQTTEEISNQNKLNSIYDTIAKQGMGSLEQKYYDLSAAARDSAKAAIEAEAQRRNIKVTDMSQAEVDSYYATATKGLDKLKEATAAQYEQSRQFKTGWTSAFNEYVDNATNAAEQAKNIFNKLTQGIEDSLFNMVKTGKFAWKDLMNTMVDELLRSQIKQLVANIGTGLSNNNTSGGGFLGGLGNLLGFANGGIIPTNGPVIVGERGPEIISGAAGRTVTPNNQLGTTVNYNINAVDAMSFKQMLAADPTFLYAVSMQGARSLPGRI